jgi:hypothetical protein
VGGGAEIAGGLNLATTTTHIRSRQRHLVEEKTMAIDPRYKIIDVNPDPDEGVWTTHMEDVINEHAREGWELVTAFQREHEALQVGSTVTHLPGLVSTVLVFKRAA